MLKEKLYDIDDITFADYDFNCCNKKEILSEMLENQEPIEIESVDFNGTKWSLYYGDWYLSLCINNVEVVDGDDSYMFFDLLQFLLQLADNDSKLLICPFESEGIVSAFITKPIDNEKIRLSIFYQRDLCDYTPDVKFRGDFVIKKDVFLKQMSEILAEYSKYLSENFSHKTFLMSVLKYVLDNIDEYFNNKEDFKQKYDPVRHIRVFDIAYKKNDNNWYFEMCLENSPKADILYWEIKKNAGRILDYDFIEQDREDLFDWKDNRFEKLTITEIEKKLKTDMDDRLERNWVYSNETNRWYSKNEMMPAPEKESLCTIETKLNYEIEIKPFSSTVNEEMAIRYFIEDSFELPCLLKIKSNNQIICNIDFDYRHQKQIKETLSIVQAGEYVRLDLNYCSKMHIWQRLYPDSKSTNAEYLTVACYENCDENKTKEQFVAEVKKDDFINCFLNALDDIQKKINTMKYVIETGEK